MIPSPCVRVSAFFQIKGCQNVKVIHFFIFDGSAAEKCGKGGRGGGKSIKNSSSSSRRGNQGEKFTLTKLVASGATEIGSSHDRLKLFVLHTVLSREDDVGPKPITHRLPDLQVAGF